MFAFLALTFAGLSLQDSIVNVDLFKEDKLYSVLIRLVPIPKVTPPKVAFAVQLSKEITKLGSHQIIVYDKVFLNDGNGFDVRHGHFTAPVKGVYLLSVIIYTDRNNDLSLDLLKNGQAVIFLYVNGNTDRASSTIVLPILLQQGDMVWVRTHAGNEGKALPGSSQYMLNAFTGALLYAL
ncbi:unnamed protein product [Mytilus coruscus]|uniref:C1q domain-containing protein n=1 Tax=Mytilus coruscus TaxID=42192 RepID=A0A6J8CCR3_MYTCO|nr:unnamed protein product [Mytilus coruscus]